MRGLEDVAVLPGMGCAAAPGSRGRGRRRPEPSSRGAERRRWPSARAASRGERTYWFWLEPGRDFFFHNLLVGLGLGYAKPYPCSPLATPVSPRELALTHALPERLPSISVSCPNRQPVAGGLTRARCHPLFILSEDAIMHACMPIDRVKVNS